jgi:glycosyltransferase involved in cell wall biosynthesis
MYNAAGHIAETLDSVCSQVVPKRWQLEIIVVDDASVDKSRRIVSGFPDKRVRLINHQENGGRAITRNSGLEAASGEYCLFIDADCSYCSRYAIKDYIYHFERGTKACFGAVSATGNSFWARYQRDNYFLRREGGNSISLVTTQNFGAEKELLLTIGGFDTRYQKYGFEDRDLFLTIRDHLQGEKIEILPHLIVYHRDRTSIIEVCRKMHESGLHSSAIFRKKYPHEYSRMNYGKIDLSLMPKGIVHLCRLILLMREFLKLMGDKAVQAGSVPYKFKRYVVKCLSALFYMAGTEDRMKK